MKKIQWLTVALGFAIAASANASESRSQLLGAELTKVTLHPSHFVDENVGLGRIAVDLDQNQVILTLENKWRCPRGMYCTMVMPAPVIKKLPLRHFYTNACGETLYIAVRDMRPADGIMEQITVQDNRFSVCERVYAAMTEIEYLTSFYDMRSGKEISGISTFLAEELEETQLLLLMQ